MENDAPDAPATALFVGNIPFGIVWQELKDLFGEAGTVIRANVATRRTGESRGFGTILMSTPEEAENAITMFDGYDLNGRNLQVRKDRGKPIRRAASPAPVASNGETRGDTTNQKHALYVGNIPYTVGWQDLKDKFREAGHVERADVPQDSQGRSKGFGIVHMSTAEESLTAIEMLNGSDMDGREIEVREDRGFKNEGGPQERRINGTAKKTFNKPERPSPPTNEVEGTGHLYVGNLPFTVKAEELSDLFREAGDVVRADVVLDYQGRSRGYGQVTMASIEDAEAAIQQLNGSELQGRTIEVRNDKFAGEPKAAHVPGTLIFINNLPFSYRWQDLKDKFREIGFEPTHTDVHSEPGTRRSRGSGSARFATVEEAERAIQECNGMDVGGRNITVRLDKFA